MDKKIPCSICRSDAEACTTGAEDECGIRCGRCGVYHLTEKARVTLDLLIRSDRAMLASYVRSQPRNPERPLLLDELELFRRLARALYAE